MSFQNPDLYSKMKTLVQKAFSIIKPILDEAFGIKENIVNIGQPFFITLLSTSKPRFDILLNRYKYAQIEKLPELRECKELMESDSAISKYINKYVGTSRGLVWVWTTTHIYYILEKIIERYFYERKYDSELFNSLYHDFERLCYEGHLLIKDIAPLHNFIISGPKKEIVPSETSIASIFKFIQLDNNLRIKEITQEENIELFNFMKTRHLSLFEVGEPQFAIECDIEQPILRQIRKPVEVPLQKFPSEDLIDAVVTGLRIFRSRFVGYSNIFPFKDLDVFVALKHRAKNIVRENELGAPYTIDQDDLQEFQNFWNDHGNVLKEIHQSKSKWKELSNTIDHFNYSYYRSNSRDKLIDLSVSVEALFQGKGGIGGTLAHKFSLRMSRFVGKSHSERQYIYEKMKKASDQRGEAVHSSSREKFDYHCLEGLVREAIKEYLKRIKDNNSITHEDIMDSVDYD